jgi:hypothetical protein
MDYPLEAVDIVIKNTYIMRILLILFLLSSCSSIKTGCVYCKIHLPSTTNEYSIHGDTTRQIKEINPDVYYVIVNGKRYDVTKDMYDKVQQGDIIKL